MATMERLTTADGREVHFLSAYGPSEFARTYRMRGRHRLLLAWDAGDAPVETVEMPLAAALDAGCVVLSAWGLGCERVHDICDELVVAREIDGRAQDFVMTQWFAHDPLAEALWMTLDVMQPAEECRADSDTWVVGVIGDDTFSTRVRSAMTDYRAAHMLGRNALVRLAAADPSCTRTLAAWFMEEWHGHYAGRRIQDVATDFLPAPDSKVPLVLVASIEGEMIGTVAVRGAWDAAPEFHPPWIGGLYVRPAFRGRGLGSQLVECAVAAARKLGCGEVHAAVRAPDVNSYLRKAWEIVGQVEADDGPVTVIRRQTHKNQARGAP